MCVRGTSADLDETTVHAIAEKMVGGQVQQCQRVVMGGNNRLFRLETTSGPFALKFYRFSLHDPRNRQETEATALLFLAEHGLRNVPRLLVMDRERGCSLLEWIDGQPALKVGVDEIDQLLQLVEALHALSRLAESRRLPWASAACCSGVVLEAQLTERYARLLPVLPIYPELATFILENFAPTMKNRMTHIRETYQRTGVNFASDLPLAWRTLSPSDFGFHNALQNVGGDLIFLDFEYFGWDDPVKLTADFLLHPGMNFTGFYPEGRKRFFDGVVRIFQKDSHFLFRMETLFPMFGLCWVLILLNEFIPEGWSQRCFASNDRDRTTAQKRQLHKAHILLNRLQINDWKILV